MKQQQNNLARPRQDVISLVDLLKNTWEIYKNNFATFVGIMAIPFLAGAIIGFVFVFIFSVIGIASILSHNFIPFLSLIIVLIPLMFLLVLWPQIALLYAIKQREQKISIKQAYRKGWHKILSYWWITILSAIIVLGGLILLIAPGVIFAVWFSLASYVLINEEKKGMDALKRSKELVKGNWLQVFARFLFLGIVLIIIVLPISWITEQLNASLIESIFTLLITPIGPIFGFLLYEDLKRLKESV